MSKPTVPYQGVLFGMGNPLLDISVIASDDFLKKYGLEANNAILAEDKHKPLYADMIDTFHHVEYIPGGATQNTIKVAQWILELEHAATYFGCVGNDKYSAIMKEKINEVGVNVRYQYASDVPTGTCAVLITGSSRSLCAYLGAANCFTIDHLNDAENWKLVEKAKYYYIAGFFLTVAPDAMLKVAKHSQECGKTFSMNLSAPFLCEFFKDPMMKVFPYIDILFGNETEAEKFAEVHDLGTKNVAEIAKIVAKLEYSGKGSRTVVFTQGNDDIVVVQDGILSHYKISELDPKVIEDTNGAGDAFCGGFLAQLVLGKEMAECIRCGIWSAQLIIQRSGCTFPDHCDFK